MPGRRPGPGHRLALVSPGRPGRLRAARLGPDGALYVTTSSGDGDRLLRVTLT